MQDPNSVRSLLMRVELHNKAGQTHAELTFTGEPLALQADMSQLKLQAEQEPEGAWTVQAAPDAKSFTLSVRVPPQTDVTTKEDPLGTVVERVYDLIHCRLGGMAISADGVPFAPHNISTTYSPIVVITPQIDRADKSNLVGKYSMDVLSRKFASGRSFIVDPRGEEGSLQLFNIMSQHPKASDAKREATQEITKLEKEFGIYYITPRSLMLTSLSTKPLDDATRKKALLKDVLAGQNLFVTTATLMGSDEMLTKAQEALEGAFPHKQFRMVREGNGLKVMLCGDETTDPGRLVNMIHRKTMCRLPMDLHASVANAGTSGYNAAIETDVWEDVPGRQRSDTGNAMTGYVAMACPTMDVLTVERARKIEQLRKPRVVVQRPYDSRAQAEDEAETLAEKVRKRMRSGSATEVG